MQVEHTWASKMELETVVQGPNGLLGERAMLSEAPADATCRTLTFSEAFFMEAAGIRAVNFNDPSLITCFGNDFGYDRWVAEALKAHADPGDLVILISSSGESDNILNAATTAEEMGLRQLVLSGFSPANRLRGYGEVSLWVDSTSYNHVENTHQVWLLAVVDYLIAGSDDSGTSVTR